MEKLKMQSHDVIGSNTQKIAQLFPNCVTERLGKDGKPELAIDFEKLQAELSNEIITDGEERYQFTWPDKRAAVRLANTPTTMTLRPCREESIDFDNTQNLFIEGDNLDVLKVLRETYLGKVKMIYIDPPYNTGNDFVYNDDFSETYTKFAVSCKVYDEDGKLQFDPKANGESNGRFHTDWLNMIYPRLKVARDLLTEDGVIFISLDDKEVANLCKICTEIFGERNFVGNIIWQSRTSISNDDEISTNHNHTLVYSKNREKLTFGGDDIDVSEYVNPDNDPRGPWKLVPIDANHVGGDTNYPIRNPKTGIDYYPPNGRIWCYNKQTLKSLMADGRIKFGLSDDSSPKRKLFLNERKAKGDSKTPSSILLDAGTTKSGTSEIMSLFDNEKVFDYPKPTTLITRLMKYGYLNDNDVIMDFFSGSGTTAHAVMKLNAEDGGNRKFIMVQLPEKTDEKSEAYKAGYKNICEIGKERIRRAGKKIKEEAGLSAQNLDTGFRVLKLDSSNMDDVYYTPQEFELQSLFNENVKADRTNEDLLFQVMLDLGIELSAKIESKQIAEENVHFVDDNYLVACFDRDVNESTITEIAKLQPIYFVMRDASAANDNVIDNFEQIFKHYSPDTNCRII